MPKKLAWLAAMTLAICGLITLNPGDAFHVPVQDFAATPADFTVAGGEAQGQLGISGAAGDFNNDGVDDILLGAPGLDSSTGGAYIVFGSTDLSGVTDLAQAAADVKIVGIDPGDSVGASVAAGDFNNDGFDDALLGAPGDDGFPDARSNAGGAYVVFGSANMGGVIEITGLVNRLRVVGATAGDALGVSAAAADMSGDGIDDILLGAPLADGPMDARANAGEAFVIWGSPLLVGVYDVASDPTVRIVSSDPGGKFGASAATGDFGNQGRPAALVGAPEADGFAGQTDRGNVFGFYIGSTPGLIDVNNAPYNLRIVGAETGDQLGQSVASGDFNNDGIDDVLTGAPRADGDFNARQSSGEAYVVLGIQLGAGGAYDAQLALGEHALRVMGADPGDQLGDRSVAGDFNDDGVDDALISAFAAGGVNNLKPVAGEAYAIYGDPPDIADIGVNAYNARFVGADEDDTLHALTSADFNDDGVDDVLLAAPSADAFTNSDRDTDTDSLAHANANPHTDPNGDADSGPHAYADRYTHGRDPDLG
jgi:hypothetical protein